MALERVPPTGAGFNPQLLQAAKAGVIAGLDDASIRSDLYIRGSGGARRVLDVELDRAIRRARQMVVPFEQYRKSPNQKPKFPTKRPRVKSLPRNYALNLVKKYVGVKPDATYEDLIRISPIEPGSTKDGSWLRHLYEPEDYVLIGSARATKPILRDAWMDRLRCLNSGSTSLIVPHVMLNPLSGGLGEKACSNGLSYRADSCVTQGRFLLIEADDPCKWPLQRQCAFLYGAILKEWPIHAVIYSGGKSLHAWYRINQKISDWPKASEFFFDKISGRFATLGFDKNCKNLGRLSRTPWFLRDGKVEQELLYLKSIH